MHKLIFIFFVTISGCVPYQFKKKSTIKNLGVKLIYSDTTDTELISQYHQELEKFMEEYNLSFKHPYRLHWTKNIDSSALQLEIYDVRYASVGRQLSSLGLTIIGVVVLPAFIISTGSPICLPIWFVPKNRSFVNISFSKDLVDPSYKNLKGVFRSGAYFGGKDVQIRKHERKIKKNYKGFFGSVESMYKKHLIMEEQQKQIQANKLK